MNSTNKNTSGGILRRVKNAAHAISRRGSIEFLGKGQDHHLSKDHCVNPTSTTTRDTRVSFIDKSSSSKIEEMIGMILQRSKNCGYYSLGDEAKKEHMKIFNCFEEHLVALAQLKEMDHAFVQRSNGSWKYAVVVGSSVTSPSDKPSIKFLVDDKGHTKEIPLRQWTKLIRVAHNISDHDHIDSKIDLMLSSMAVNEGGNELLYSHSSKSNHHPEVVTSKQSLDINRRNSEACLPREKGRRLTSKRRVYPADSRASSFVTESTATSSSRLSGINKSTSTSSNSSLLRGSHRQRFSDIDHRKVSWRLSTIESASDAPNAAFDVKFNQHAFLSALASIGETPARV